jgi:hypothetical protein
MRPPLWCRDGRRHLYHRHRYPGSADVQWYVRFGDSLVFLAAFGLTASQPPAPRCSFCALCTRSGTFFRSALWPSPRPASRPSLTSLCHQTTTGSLLGAWSGLSPIGVLLAPLLAISFFLSLVRTNSRSCIVLLAASAIETVVFYGLLSYGLVRLNKAGFPSW